MPNEETIEQAITRMQGVDLNEFVRLIEDEINKRAFLKALEFVKPDNGVTVWVSWDDNSRAAAPELWATRPRPNMNGTFTGKVSHEVLADALGMNPGQCKQFLITEVVG